MANRGVQGEYNPWPNTPKFQRIFVRNLSEHTYNSAVGLGMADVVTDRLVNRIDWDADLDQFADRQHARGDPHADPFPDRPRVPGAHRAHRRKTGTGRSDLRLDPQHDGVDAPGAERKRPRRSGAEPACWKSRRPSISNSIPPAI